MAILDYTSAPTPAPPLRHDWVQWSVQAVAVIVDPFTGESSVIVDPAGAIGSQVGCTSCGEPLTDSSALTTCTGEHSDLSP